MSNKEHNGQNIYSILGKYKGAYMDIQYKYNINMHFGLSKFT